MRTSFRLILAAGLVLAAFSSPLLAEQDSDWSTDRLDDSWAEHALDYPEQNRGWCQSSRPDWKDDRVVHCEVRVLRYPRLEKPIEIAGGQNSGMTVMGWDRDSVRILYRVTARASTEERAREIAADVQLELTKGMLRPQGPFEATHDEWWSVEIFRSSNCDGLSLCCIGSQTWSYTCSPRSGRSMKR